MRPFACVRAHQFDVPQRLQLRPRHHHLRQGTSSATPRSGAMVASDRLFGTVRRRHHRLRARVHLLAATRSRRSRWANLDIFRARGSQQPRHIHRPGGSGPPSSGYWTCHRGDVRRGASLRDRTGQGQGRKEILDDELSASGCCAALSVELFEAGLYCPRRRPCDSVIQLAPPLISDQAVFDEIRASRGVLTRAWDQLQTRGDAWADARSLMRGSGLAPPGSHNQPHQSQRGSADSGSGYRQPATDGDITTGGAAAALGLRHCAW